MNKYKKYIVGLCIGLVCVCAFVVALPTIQIHFMDGHYLTEGIEKYNPEVSSMSLCKWLTVRYERDDVYKNEKWFIYQFEYLKGFYRQEELYKNGYGQETATLVLTYTDEVFESVLLNVKSQKGYSKAILYSYKDFIFHFNFAEWYDHGRYTDYNLDGDKPYLHWINLVGYSEIRKEIAFLGFYYIYQWRSGFWDISESYYPFEGWDAFMEKEFQFYNW